MPLGCVIKCHPTSTVLTSAVLSCLFELLCNAVPSLFGVYLLRPGVRIEIITAFTVNFTAFWNVVPCRLVYIYLYFGGKSYLLLPNLKIFCLCQYGYLQTQFKLTKLFILSTRFSSKLIYITFINSVPTIEKAILLSYKNQLERLF